MAVRGVSFKHITLLVVPLFLAGSNAHIDTTTVRNGIRDEQNKRDIPEHRVYTTEGDTVFFRYSLGDQRNLENSTVECKKNDSLQIVSVCRHGKKLIEDQDEVFRGRAFFDCEGLKTGNWSLKLENVTTDDSGRYYFWIPKKGIYCYFNLTVDKVPKKQNDTEKAVNSTTTSAPDNQGRSYWDLGSIIVVAIGTLIIILIARLVYFQIKRRKAKERDQDNPLNVRYINHQGAPSSALNSAEISIDLAAAEHLVTHTETNQSIVE